MKIFVVLASFVAACLAQSINIASPAPLTPISSRDSITVEIDRPTAGPVEEEVLIISVAPCIPQVPEEDCNNPDYDPSNFLGQPLYNGPYDPQNHGDGKPPYQNFTIQIPLFSTLTTQASLVATHFSLVGPSPHPFLEVKNVILDVEQ